MCSPSPPSPPDTVGAAMAQGAANKEAAIATSRLNNPNVVSPFGAATYTEGAAPDSRPTLNQVLNPEQQGLLDTQNRVKAQLGGLGEQGATALQGIVGKPFDLSSMPAAPTDATATRDKVINAMMSRVDEDYGNQRDQANSDMIAAGLRPGTKAYQDRMFALDRGRNDARQQAIIAGGSEAGRDFTMNSQARQAAIAEALAQRQTPLNEVTALMSGSQVTNPFTKGADVNPATIAPPNIAGAQQQSQQFQTDVYNQQVGSSNSTKSGLAGLGGAALMAAFF